MRILTGLLAAVLLAVGCQNSKPPIGGKPRQKTVMSIVSLSPSTTEIVGGLRIVDRLKGRTASCDFPFGISKVPIVMQGTKPDYERLASLQPDLVVYDASLFSQSDVEKFKELNFETLPMDVHNESEYDDYVFALGKLTGQETVASELVDDLVGAVAEAKGQAPADPPKTIVLMAGAPYMAAGAGSFQAWAVNASGGKFIGPEGTKFVSVGVEQIVAWAPDVIILASDGSKVLGDSGLASVPAVKNRRVIEVKDSVLFRTGMRVTELVRALAQVFAGRFEGNR